MARTATPPVPADDIAEVAHEVYAAVALCVRRLKQMPAVGSISLAERSMLSRIDRSGVMTAADLARAEGITAQAVGATLAGLEARDLVVRRPHQTDRRRVILSVSERGRDELRQLRDARASRVAELLGEHFTPVERARLAKAAPLIARLAEHL